MTDNKRVTNKQIMEELERFRKALSKTAVDLTLYEDDLNTLATKIVARLMNIQTMEKWYDHVSNSTMADKMQNDKLDMTEEEQAIGDAAKYMTLLNLFQDKEEYEKCAVCKLKLDRINKILKKY